MIRKAAVVFLENEAGEVLLSKKGLKSRYEPGMWELCGGAVEEDESFEQTAVREALEEIGVSIQILEILSHDTYPDMGDGITWEVMVFRSKTADVPRIMELDKCVELRWVSKSEMSKMKTDLSAHLTKDLQNLGWL